METIIGLGQAGCKIAEQFAEYTQYSVYKIDSEKLPGPKFKLLKKSSSHEEYEKNCPSFKRFFKDAKPPYLFIVSGAGSVSGSSLRILEQLNSKEIYVLYIRPDVSLLSELKKKQERAGFHILQEFARSGLLKRMFLVDNSKLEEIIQDTPVIGYYDKLNKMIVSTIHMINVCTNSKPVLETFGDPAETARISTLGLVDLETGKETLFFDLKMPREKVYFYMIHEDKLKSDGELLKTITGQVRSRMEGGKVQTSFGIYSTEYEQDYVYVLSHTSLIQNETFYLSNQD
jgi:hypothetical protein